MSRKTIAIYGKGGIGKSTTTSNLAAAASLKKLKTMIIGCDPKADTIHSLIEGDEEIKTILEMVRQNGSNKEVLESCIYEGFNKILCVESGGPSPGVGCAGKGVALALQLLKEYSLFHNDLDFILFDVLGDVVCGGFAQPMRSNFADEIYVVTSGEYMSLYQAVNIASSIKMLAEDGVNVKMGGIICNKRNVENEDNIIQYLSDLINVPIIQTIPRSHLIQQSEAMGITCVEAFPQSDQAHVYYDLVDKILNNKNMTIPHFQNRNEILQKLKVKIGESSKLTA